MEGVDFLGLLYEYIKADFIIVAVALYALGMFLKDAPGIKDWVIPFVLLGTGIVFTVLTLAIILEQGFTAKVILEGVLQGILCAALAVFSNQMIKQVQKREKNTP